MTNNAMFVTYSAFRTLRWRSKEVIFEKTGCIYMEPFRSFIVLINKKLSKQYFNKENFSKKEDKDSVSDIVSG